MTGILSIRSSLPVQDVATEMKKEEEKVRNILFLLFILIGVNGAELLEETVGGSSSKVEALKTNFEKKQKKIDRLNDRLKEVSNLYDQLNKDGSRLEDLTKSERKAYFEKSDKLQHMFQDLQTEVQLKMKDASKVMQEIVKTSKMDIEPLKEIIEAHQNMGTKLTDLFTGQWGNNINLKK